jgi:hypothetical protein
MKQDIISIQDAMIVGKELKIYQWKLYPRNHIETKFELGYTFLETNSYWETCQHWKDKRKEVKIVGTVKVGALIGMNAKQKQETGLVNTSNAIQAQTKPATPSFYEEKDKWSFAVNGLASLCATINKGKNKLTFANSHASITFEITKCEIDDDVKFDGADNDLFMMGTN